MPRSKHLVGLTISFALIVGLSGLAQADLIDLTQIGFGRYQVGNSQTLDIWTVNPDGTGLTNLTNTGFMEQIPRWSPDGRSIMYIRSDDPWSKGDIYIMDANGLNQRPLPPPTLTIHERDADWSPDGTHIVFNTRDQAGGTDNYYLYTMDTNGNNKVPLTPGQRGDTLARWSPDGNWIGFTRARTPDDPVIGHGQLFLINTQTKIETPLPYVEEDDFMSAWSPDGKMIAFTSGRGGNRYREQIWVMNADGSGPRQITNDGYRYASPCWSPDGKQITYTRCPGYTWEDTDVWAAEWDPINLRLVSPRNITNTPGVNERTPQWSPVLGKRLTGVPDYLWNYGCTPTSGGMVAGYWDRNGFPNLVPGVDAPITSGESGSALHPRDTSATRYEPDYGNTSVNSMIASEGHHRDFWAHGLPVGDGGGIDPMLDSHAPNCIADFMGTSRGVLTNGYTFAVLEGPGMFTWAASKGYASFFTTSLLSADIWAYIRSNIDLGRPLLVDWPKHTTTCYGYRDGLGDDRWLAIYDTWWDGNSNGMKYLGASAIIEAQMDGDGVEWWRFRAAANPENRAWVQSATTWWPLFGLPSLPFGTLWGDSFSRPAQDGQPTTLGYTIASSSAAGTAEIVPSPLDPLDDVLKLSNPDAASWVAIERDVCLSESVAVTFRYLFGADGKIKVYLDGKFLLELACPEDGAGSIGADEFGQYDYSFALADLGLDPMLPHDLRFEVCSARDPLFYLDDLRVWNPVPEPATFTLLLVSGLWALLARRRH